VSRGAPVESPQAVGDIERITLDARTNYLAVLGDPSTFSQQLRIAACETVLARRQVLIVDMSLACPVRASHLQELGWANARLTDRGGVLGVISDPDAACGALADLASHQPPEVAGTLREMAAALGMDYDDVRDALGHAGPT
jgi:hypothetical protein